MLTKNMSITIHATMETVWKLLFDRKENPISSLPGMRESGVQEIPEGYIREMTNGTLTVRERITTDKTKWEVQSELLEHPQYTGTITIRLVPTSVQNPMAPLELEYNLQLERKSFHLENLLKADEDLVAAIRKEMMSIKESAEMIEEKEG